MSKAKKDFLEQARRDQEIAETQRKLYRGELIRVQGSDYILNREDYQQLVDDLASQNLALSGPKDSPKDTMLHYPTDKYAIAVVELRPKQQERSKGRSWYHEGRHEDVRAIPAAPARNREFQLN